MYAIIDLDEVTSFKLEREQALMAKYCYEPIQLHVYISSCPQSMHKSRFI